MKQIEVQERRVADLRALADAENIKATGENVTAIQLLMESLEEPHSPSGRSDSRDNEEFGKESILQVDAVVIADSLHGPPYDSQQEKNPWCRKMVLEPPPIPKVEAHEHLLHPRASWYPRIGEDIPCI